MSSTAFLEICCDSIQSAISAEKGDADRIELCSNLAQGGTSPSAGLLALAKVKLSIPVFVLVRPRKADFFYSNLELECMLQEIKWAKKLGADGIVSGALLPDGQIDLVKTRQLIEAAHPLPFTFHRAFDMCVSPLAALESLIQLDVNYILTSGQQARAIDGVELLKKLVEQSKNSNTSIIAGGGIRPANISILKDIKGLSHFHASASQTVLSQMLYRGKANMGVEEITEEFYWKETDEDTVKQLKKSLLS